MGSGHIERGSLPDENLDILPSIVAHEFHHTVLFANGKWDFMDITVAKYLAVKGLAERFAENLYGFESRRPWVNRLACDELEQARRVIRKALDVKGFGEVRKYMFGDQASYEGAERTGIPPIADMPLGTVLFRPS
ncbi:MULTISPECIES: DUF2268 domain-containing putative Zn-dependent protease [Paenibacillaceae]|uniref:DUF2268 domain-containing putative Zn-dependent protease n=1 Tax=Paenibacillaceae TaxID=186822 RepID=UPI0012D90334|nr:MULTISPECIES: DUF2268 domain-containing putative Zn-dependent protease [Paenibacillaceae]